MFNTSRQLKIDVKAQDRLREWFSRRGDEQNVVLTCLTLGDSDVDYELSDQAQDIQILSAPYNVPQIKHKLVFKGSDTNFTGQITAFARNVADDGTVSSLYGFPPDDTNFTAGVVPPTLANGFNIDEITFNGGIDQAREGFIVFLQTLPDNFFNDNGVALRFVEQYDITVENLPPAIDVDDVDDSVSPIKITTQTPHGRSTGDEVVLAEIGLDGSTLHDVNDIFTITTLSTTEFTLDGTTGQGRTYDGGGKVVTWELQIDNTNGSLLLGKTNIPLQGGTDGEITVRGLLSGITKTIGFNY